MNTRTSLVALAAFGALALGAPAHATLLNIQAYSDATSTGSGVDNSNAVVGDTLHFTNAVTLNLAAGDYAIADAWGTAGAKYDAWNFESSVGGSWTSHFFVGAYESGTSDFATYKLLMDNNIAPGPGHYGGYDTEAEASAVFQSTAPFILHLSQATTVGFTASDYYLPDNQGGISISVTAVPEPGSVALMFAGMASMGLLAARRRRQG